MTTQEHSRDSRTLVLSVVASSVFAMGSLVWGLLLSDLQAQPTS